MEMGWATHVILNTCGEAWARVDDRSRRGSGCANRIAGGSGGPQVFQSLYQRRAKDLAILLRGQLDAAATPVEMREQVQLVNPELPVFGAQMLDEMRDRVFSERRFSMEMVALFGLTALLLAVLGIYGVISYT